MIKSTDYPNYKNSISVPPRVRELFLEIYEIPIDFANDYFHIGNPHLYEIFLFDLNNYLEFREILFRDDWRILINKLKGKTGVRDRILYASEVVFLEYVKKRRFLYKKILRNPDLFKKI